jgi:hypothetical protein
VIRFLYFCGVQNFSENFDDSCWFPKIGGFLEKVQRPRERAARLGCSRKLVKVEIKLEGMPSLTKSESLFLLFNQGEDRKKKFFLKV